MKNSLEIKKIALAARTACYIIYRISGEKKNTALKYIAANLKKHRTKLLQINQKEINRAISENLPDSLLKRLDLSSKFDEMIDGINELLKVDDPVGKILLKRKLDEKLILSKISVPIGVIGIIFESRPDALVQIVALCLKSGNTAILIGGSEAIDTNTALFELILKSIESIPELNNSLHLLASRTEVNSLLELDNLVDLIIPRGSKELVKFISNNTRIPVLGHADGICHVYIDEDADIKMATKISLDSKVQSASVCNACENLLVHKTIANEILPQLVEKLRAAKVEVRGDEKVQVILDVIPSNQKDWNTEYLDLILSIKIVDDLEEAIFFINQHSSHHTDSIITNNKKTAKTFLSSVDSATVIWNASTRFADGYRFGMGAELGISTNRIHARGPVGLDGLVIYKFLVQGNGEIVADYVSGKKNFNFADLDDEASENIMKSS